jgi:hypothetical protein
MLDLFDIDGVANGKELFTGGVKKLHAARGY